MTKINRVIEIVRTNQPGLSSLSQRSADALLVALNIYYSNVRITQINNLGDLEKIIVRKPDLVFLGVQYLPVNPALGAFDPEKVWISQYLQDHDIVTTGSGYLAHELEIEKPLAKQRVLLAGLKTAPYFVVMKDQPKINSSVDLNFPLFVKPTNRGGGSGINEKSVVHNHEELWSKVKSLADDLNSDALVEELLPGREFSVALLKDLKTNSYLILPVEISADGMLSSDVKSSNSEIVVTITDQQLKASVSALAVGVFHSLGGRDYGRIDIRLNSNDEPCFLEANLIPSLIEGYGTFPKACLLNENIGYHEMLLRIVDLAIARGEEMHLSKIQPVLTKELLAN